CEGQRPSCAKCVQAGESCVYEVAEDETRYTALKKTNKSLMEDNSEMQQLLDCLRTRSEAEALDILHRLRSGADPSTVLELVRDGDLLLQASTRRSSGPGGDVDGGVGSTRDYKQRAYSAKDKRRSRSGSFEIDGEANAEKMVDMERKYAALKKDMDRMHELYRYIHAMPEAEVTRVVLRIRSTEDPLTVLDLLNLDPALQ
ncbi:MAG: hypothetical protein Q9195_009428, partial [Heterodermia aff. obscurata]